MSDFVLNWVAHVKRLEGKYTKFLVAALDLPLLELCETKGLPAITLAQEDGLIAHTDYFRADEKKFVRMGEIKVDLVRALLVEGYHIIISDADVVFFGDPWPFLIPGLAEGAAMQHRVGAMVRADVLSTTDCIDEEEDTHARRWLMNKEFNTGVLFFRGTNQSVAVVDRWKDRILAEKGQGLYINDQAVFNRAFHATGGYNELVVPQTKQDPPEPSKDKYWDRASLRRVYLMRDVPTVPPTTTIGVLPMVEFINGHSFFVARLHEQYKVKPVALHTTYQFGDTPQYSHGKRERLRRAGLWLVDDDAYYQPGPLLSIKGDLLQGFDPPAEVKAPKDGGIDFHIAADAFQRQRLAHALAIAMLLGRTLVLPPLMCYCDRYWWLLHMCRMPGAERMDLPYECPMDHIFEPIRWFDNKMPFRSAGFLEDPRAPQVPPAARVPLPETCFCTEEEATGKECELKKWEQRKAELAGAAVVEVEVGQLDLFCAQVDYDWFNRIKAAFHMRVGLCARERNIIPHDWKPEKLPLNCSWGYQTPFYLSAPEVAARRRRKAAAAKQ